MTDITDFRLSEHFTGAFYSVFGGGSCFQLQIYRFDWSHPVVFCDIK
jgi:hypothetical protein